MYVYTYISTYAVDSYVLYLRYNVPGLSSITLSASRHTFFLSGFGYGLWYYNTMTLHIKYNK